ncbi:MAG: c-type cytochrome, partial [Deltaproteobacteria bacterium]
SLAYAGSALAADGAAIFKAKCLPCHGPDGAGTAMAPAFKGNAFIKDGKLEDIMAVVTNGRAGAEKKYKQFAIAMPPQKGAMSEADIKAVVEYGKTLAGK